EGVGSEMTRLTSRQRKYVYAGLIAALAFPIIHLGAPSTGGLDSGGVLAKLRELPVDRGGYDLGETTFGQLDPSSAAMNLVLLGLRGPAVLALHVQLIDQQRTKNWALMRATTDSIITLQPHYLQVWRFHGWNMAYNVSAEWDGVADRWYWVKEGGKFTMRGVERNQIYAELPWEVGRIESQKVGRSDEWRQFRVYFRVDPDTDRFGGGPDPGFNRAPRDPLEPLPGTQPPYEPTFPDNYLCSKAWFLHANQVELGRVQRIMMRMLFRHYPVRSQFDYAEALQRDGAFGDEEATRFAWDRAYEEWTGENRESHEFHGYDYQAFGKQEFESEGGTIMLDPTDEDIAALARKDRDRFLGTPLTETASKAGETAASLSDIEEFKRQWVHRYQDTCNYIYWKRRARLERREDMAAIHRELFLGKQAVLEGLVDFGPDGEPPVSVVHLERGLKQFAALQDELVQAEDTREEVKDRNVTEEILMGMLYWRHVLETINGRPLPEDRPLKEFWESEDSRGLLPDLRARFQSDLR
ncbi:MAG TPA: hypothetical protein VML55_15220, partial [Planctomycetaceae bacterium]|nr:hypothetical protein [Planctomycetaceae bacterium]